MGLESSQLEVGSKKELLMRLQSPSHITKNHFSEHAKIEGYNQEAEENSFTGCDRLLRYDNIFGTIQFGYDSKRGETFIFANIKTSILDTAASKYQKELNESSMKKSLKTESENLAYSSKRRKNAASIFYKRDAKPWRESTVQPYISRNNLESLGKNMPFLQKNEEQTELRALVQNDLKLKASVVEAQLNDTEGLKGLRAEQHQNIRNMELLNSIIIRKASTSNMFFDRLNYVFDIQKQEIFSYYRDLRAKHDKPLTADAQQPPPEEDEEV